ncbi:MAG: chemotaxis protein CheX [Planctomycetota bacterium]|jgi:chemotaxis protein CheX
MVDEVCLNDALLTGATEVFETMIFMDINESSEQQHNVEGDTLLGSITFTGDLEGCLAICCSVACARTIALNMLGMEQTEDLAEEEIADAMGEVANMVMGSVKSRIQETAGNLNVSIPTVVRGRKLDNSLRDHANKVSKKLNIADEYAAELSLLYRDNPK